MGTQILAAGTTEAVSAEQTIAAGAAHTIMLKPAAGRSDVPLTAVMVIQLKNAAGAFIDSEVITRSKQLIGPIGGYRLRRPAQIYAVGADIDES